MPLPHAACLPRCPHGRGLLAAATTPDCLGRPLLRCPHLRCLVADGASSAAHHQAMYTCPAARPCPPGGRDCAALARDPLPRKACAAICTETVQGTPWHRSRYPKQTVASNFQGTPNLYVDGLKNILLGDLSFLHLVKVEEAPVFTQMNWLVVQRAGGEQASTVVETAWGEGSVNVSETNVAEEMRALRAAEETRGVERNKRLARERAARWDREADAVEQIMTQEEYHTRRRQTQHASERWQDQEREQHARQLAQEQHRRVMAGAGTLTGEMWMLGRARTLLAVVPTHGIRSQVCI